MNISLDIYPVATNRIAPVIDILRPSRNIRGFHMSKHEKWSSFDVYSINGKPNNGEVIKSTECNEMMHKNCQNQLMALNWHLIGLLRTASNCSNVHINLKFTDFCSHASAVIISQILIIHMYAATFVSYRK